MDILLSHARAAQLAAAMERQGWTVCWELERDDPTRADDTSFIDPASDATMTLLSDGDCVDARPPTLLQVSYDVRRETGRTLVIAPAGTAARDGTWPPQATARPAARRAPRARTLTLSFQVPGSPALTGDVTVRDDRSGPAIIGRAPDAAVPIEHETVSWHHAAIEFVGAHRVPVITDLDSSNGTSVNGRRVKRAVLHVNDAVGLARAELLVRQIEHAREPAGAASH